MTRDDADAFQDWAAMDGEQAFLLIEPHADGFQVAHELMEAWARARVKEEREACAQLVELNASACRPHSELHDILSASALAIRARGEAGGI